MSQAEVEVDTHISKGLSWLQLPPSVKQSLHNEPQEYERLVLQYSVQNQLRYKGHLIQKVFKGEKQYYEELLRYSREHLMLYPYHLQDILVKGLRITPFHYYILLLEDLMCADRSYDSLPNFTAGDCLRLCGVGRNEYIDLMNQCRVSGWNHGNHTATQQPGAKRFFRGWKQPFMKSGSDNLGQTGTVTSRTLHPEGLSPRQLLPRKPVPDCPIQPWWRVHIGSVMESDIEQCTDEEKRLVDFIIDEGPQIAGSLDYMVLRTLHLRGLIYLEVPIQDGDKVLVPTLEGFVMNRVTGDYFETLLYKIFVSLDENITVKELADILQTDLELVKNAISVFCRMGFAVRKVVSTDKDTELHPSWAEVGQALRADVVYRENSLEETPTTPVSTVEWNLDESSTAAAGTSGGSAGCLGKFAFLFDSTLAAFLMMGNLSPDLKSHAVTMFEVGKLSDEALDSLLSELDRVTDVGEGEARRYYEHAVNLRHTLRFFRASCRAQGGTGVDLLRSESVLSLDAATRQRILRKNYSLLISMAPITNEDRILSCVQPPLLGPVLTEMNSPWFKLYLYTEVRNGPPTLLLARGSKLARLPSCFLRFSRVLLATWGHDPVLMPLSNVLATLNDFLLYNPVLLQAVHTHEHEAVQHYFSFPQCPEKPSEHEDDPEVQRVMGSLQEHLGLRHSCGYAVFLHSPGAEGVRPVLLDVHLGIPLFQEDLNQRVCQGLSHNESLSTGNLEQLVHVNRSLSIRLLHFINQWNTPAPSGSAQPIPPQAAARHSGSGSSTPLPLRNFLYYSGELTYL